MNSLIRYGLIRLSALATAFGLLWGSAYAAGETGAAQPVDWNAVLIFLAFVVVTLGITYWAAQHIRTAKDFYAAGGGITTRGVHVKFRSLPEQTSAAPDLSVLPRLPETADELRAAAKALDASPSADVYLGKQANEQAVRTLKLDDRRVVMFATHGLVPGDIAGLSEPALALTPPSIAGVAGSGLLTTTKILGLRLNAQWVVLSACNTAAGVGAGAEAASGLGSAFFYAGTRALLVTNWSVHSASARELIADLFVRQGADPNLSRAEALRQAMIALLDGPGMVDSSGNTVFTYAHPLFWAPYSVIGDGGGT